MLSALHNILSIAVTDKYTAEDMKFIWQNDPPLSFPSDFGDGYRLPKYVVSFVTENKTHNVYYGEGIRSIGIKIVHSFQTFTYTKYKDLHGMLLHGVDYKHYFLHHQISVNYTGCPL